ncbi:MAG: ABC transporter permease subunit [Clostridia bacterium]|nr:ABC transporter permease subunit [Clostridia bacterium]
MRALAFAKRNLKEMLKSPISYIFALGFPVLMLILFAVINRFIQDSFISQYENVGGDALDSLLSTRTTTFEMRNNAPAMAFFGLTFIMLNVALLVSKDKSSAFLLRLFTSPMKARDFIIGYALPGLALCFAQQFVCYGVGEIVAIVEGENFGGIPNSFNFGYAMLAVLSQIPAMVLFVSLGILFGTVLSDKSAPPCCSVVINIAGIFGGCYFPLAMLEGLALFAKFLPFYPQVLLSQAILSEAHLGFDNFGLYLIIACAYALVVSALAILMFERKMRSDNK